VSLSFFIDPSRRTSMAGHVRGTQVAEYLGAKLNPEDDYGQDTCIFVKVKPIPFFCGARYFDPVDGVGLLYWFHRHLDVGIIASSNVSYRFLTKQFKNKVVLIPQHHCNFERDKRVRKDVTVAGFIGGYHTFQPFEDEIRAKLKAIGVDLLFQYKLSCREDAVNFYKSIDVQIVWRIVPEWLSQAKNPLKISCAASYQIPTVSYPEDNFVAEYNGGFIAVGSIDEMVSQVKILKQDEDYYKHYAKVAYNKSDKYHIEKVAELYRRLEA